MPCVRAQVSTRWGTACMSLTEVAFRLLQLVDGSLTGRELREHMPSSTVNKEKAIPSLPFSLICDSILKTRIRDLEH